MKRLLLFLTLMMSISALGGDGSEIANFFSKRLTEVMKSYDSRSTIIVDIKTKKQNLELPGTNFLLSDNLIHNADELNVESITVTVFTELEKIPDDFTQFTVKTFDRYKVKPEIKTFKLAEGIHLEKNVAKSLEKVADSYSQSPYVLLGLFMIPAAMMFLFFGMRKEFTAINATLGNQLQTLAASVENGGGGSSSSVQSSEFQRKDTGKQSMEIEKSFWEDQSSEFFQAILSECYWCEEDEYAAFVWSKMPNNIKVTFFRDEMIDLNYINFISDKPVNDLGYGQNSYFLRPLPINHVSNEDLGKFLQKEKSLFTLLSPLRIKKIDLSLDDKVQMLKSKPIDIKDKEVLDKKLTDMKASKAREIELVKQLEFSSLEEEEKALSMDFDYSLMRSFPSLGWILKLSKDSGENILKSISAKDLALCLACPESNKKDILALIPEKKRELVVSYQKNNIATKNHPMYHVLLGNIMSELDRELNIPDNVEFLEDKKSA